MSKNLRMPENGSAFTCAATLLLPFMVWFLSRALRTDLQAVVLLLPSISTPSCLYVFSMKCVPVDSTPSSVASRSLTNVATSRRFLPSTNSSRSYLPDIRYMFTTSGNPLIRRAMRSNPPSRSGCTFTSMTAVTRSSFRWSSLTSVR
jgi:hypothetical protein